MVLGQPATGRLTTAREIERATVYEGRTTFTRGRFALIAVCVATALFAVGAGFTYAQRGWNWVSGGLAILTAVFGVGGILETLLERVELGPDALVVRRLWGTQRYPIAEIERVEEAKGVVPAVRLVNGRWIKLPDVGAHFGNSVRAWLRADRAREQPRAAASG